MRYCSTYAARALTFFTIVILYSHSFTPVLAEATGSSSASASSVSSVSSSQQQSSSNTLPAVSSSNAATSSSSAPPVLSSGSTPASHTHQPTDSSTVPSNPSPSQSLPPSSIVATSSSSPALSSSQSVSSSASPSISASSSSSSSLSLPLPSALSSSVSSVPPASSDTSNSHSTLTAANTPAGHAPLPSSFNDLPSSSAIGAAAETGVSTASSKSFFDNKGAVAGTFTVVALLGVGVVAAIVMYVMRRRHRFDDEEEAAYFEKIPDANDFSNSSSFLGGSPRATVPTTAAGTSAYPDRTTHYGTSANGDTIDDPQVYPMDYPPGTALARAATQRGAYQYTGQLGGVDYGYPPQPAALGSHPFADPVNVQQPGGAPPVTFQGAEYAMDTPYDDAVYTGVAQ